MAHFKPTYYWYEKDNGCTVSRLRWEKDDLEEKAWWVPADYPSRSGPPDYSKKAERQTCLSCQKEHPRIYAEGFVCVWHECKDFWKLNGKELTNADKLNWNPKWLAERVEWPAGLGPPFALRPQPLPQSDAKDPLFTTMRAAYKGMVCPRCGCCLPRTKFEGWFCETEGCGHEHPLPPPSLNIRIIEESHNAQFDGEHGAPKVDYTLPIKQRPEPTIKGPWRIQTYDVKGLPGCRLKQFHSNAAINRRPGSADDILAQMADPKLQLERRLLVQAVGMLALYTISTFTDTDLVDGQRCNHFSANFVSLVYSAHSQLTNGDSGLPYAFSADVPSISFREAPAVVINALRRMDWAGRIAAEGEGYQRPNEVLVLGYLEGQAIGVSGTSLPSRSGHSQY